MEEEVLEGYYAILQNFKAMPECKVFLKVPDSKMYPTYRQKVAKPMCFGTIEKKYLNGVYKEPTEFNQEGSGLFLLASRLEQRWLETASRVGQPNQTERDTFANEANRLEFTSLFKKMEMKAIG